MPEFEENSYAVTEHGKEVSGKNVTIVLIEDDPGHARLIEKNLRRSNVNNKIIVLDNGRKGLDFLFSEGEYEGQSPPTSMLVLLDLNLPVLTGYQLLERVKSDPVKKKIPIVILTTTNEEREIKKCYELGCNVYVTKPVEYDLFIEAIKKLGLFLSIVDIPAGANGV